MKKYYYDCPLQALYMNKEFGVKMSEAIKIDVSKESNHIFEPKAGDICYSRYFDDFVKIINGSFDMQVNEIIMRDGKHFFMPKVIEE